MFQTSSFKIAYKYFDLIKIQTYKPFYLIRIEKTMKHLMEQTKPEIITWTTLK